MDFYQSKRNEEAGYNVDAWRCGHLKSCKGLRKVLIHGEPHPIAASSSSVHIQNYVVFELTSRYRSSARIARMFFKQEQSFLQHIHKRG
ncbi:hypothetical protein OUZ56_001113 [Daphnia magna]|uniref:Uncharacterized protein n=1 Tax=Daphnia magna TaxID=35525 RepID=A0ABR0A1P4_9CRUS|nr:hypothetical protein OUZ56_001113 [Daphnia magna]